MPKHPITVRLNYIFIIINAIVWFIFGVITIGNLHPALPDLPYIKPAIAFIAFIFTLFLIASLFFLRKQNRTAYYLLLMFFLFVTAFTVFDDFGYSDILVFVLNLIPIILLVRDRYWYLQVNTRPEGVS